MIDLDASAVVNDVRMNLDKHSSPILTAGHSNINQSGNAKIKK